MCVYVEVLQFFVFDAKLFLYPLLNNDLHNLLIIFKKYSFLIQRVILLLQPFYFTQEKTPKLKICLYVKRKLKNQKERCQT